eukprot:UC4_evm6s670
MADGPSIVVQPFSSSPSPPFWHELTRLKTNEFGLDDSTKHIRGFYLLGRGIRSSTSGVQAESSAGCTLPPPCICLGTEAFSCNFESKSLRSIPNDAVPVRGILCNSNTLKDFLKIEKKSLARTTYEALKSDIISGRALKDTNLLCRFVAYTFADLKKYKFYYHFAFPALKGSQEASITSYTPIAQAFTNEISTQILHAAASRPDTTTLESPNLLLFALVRFNPEAKFVRKTLWELKEYVTKKSVPSSIIFTLSDPSSLPSNPGWVIRNALVCIGYYFEKFFLKNSVKVLLLRSGNASILCEVKWKIDTKTNLLDAGFYMGFEKNIKGENKPRRMDLSSQMDPIKLAETSVDLNLKLMKWRLVPSLDLEVVSKCKCLLLGAGTLGCNVARALIGWGVRKITFVDSGTVSFSNPVRQSLFEFQDCASGDHGRGALKAVAAASSLKRIFPGLNAEGIFLNIPMPGHSLVDEEAVNTALEDTKKLENLIDDHDVVFLLMDTRESRWLPTLLCANMDKICITAALGFDNYLVMRHGTRLKKKNTAEFSSTSFSPITSSFSTQNLGCYFCNDMQAPGNSTRDRTLDQQCTVSRPGLSMIASALAVEMMVSILQHPQGINAPADLDGESNPQCPLGIIPHQIRGFLSGYSILTPVAQKFNHCVACSSNVINSFDSENRDSLLRKAFEDPESLENLTGIKQLQVEAEEIDLECCEWDE